MHLLLLIAALFVSVLIFTWLIKVVKATISTAILIAVMVLVLQLVFGIGSNQLWQQVMQIPQFFWELITGHK